MRIDQQPAFILHARPYRETSLLIEAFSRDFGRVGLVARGVRRERSRLPRGLLQPFQPLLLNWIARGELGSLTGAEAASRPLRLAGDVLFAAIYVNELVLRLSERNDPHDNAFAAYSQCLGRLADDSGIAWSLRRFERDFLADLGYALALTHTVDGQPLKRRATTSTTRRPAPHHGATGPHGHAFAEPRCSRSAAMNVLRTNSSPSCADSFGRRSVISSAVTSTSGRWPRGPQARGSHADAPTARPAGPGGADGGAGAPIRPGRERKCCPEGYLRPDGASRPRVRAHASSNAATAASGHVPDAADCRS